MLVDGDEGQRRCGDEDAEQVPGDQEGLRSARLEVWGLLSGGCPTAKSQLPWGGVQITAERADSNHRSRLKTVGRCSGEVPAKFGCKPFTLRCPPGCRAQYRQAGESPNFLVPTPCPPELCPCFFIPL